MKAFEKYSLLELILLEEKFEKRLPARPFAGDYRGAYATYDLDTKDWHRQNDVTENTLIRIQQEINNRMEALQKEINETP